VEALCAPGGLRAAPTADALRLFVERASGLDGGRVAGLLREQLVRAPAARTPTLPCSHPAHFEGGSCMGAALYSRACLATPL
jgi:hypothetical protein